MVYKIGYLGIENGDTKLAAMIMTERLHFKPNNIVWTPCNTIDILINKLVNNEVSYIVFPVKSDVNYIISEYVDIFERSNTSLECLASEVLTNKYCLFTKNHNIKVEDIQKIYIEKPIYNLCEKYFKRNFKHDIIEYINISQKRDKLNGNLEDNQAIVCREEEGINLQQYHENIEDKYKNKTEYRLFKLYRFNQRSQKHCFLMRIFSKIKNLSKRKLVGYWKCFIVPDVDDQIIFIPKIMKIDYEKKKYKVKLWFCDSTLPIYESYHTSFGHISKKCGTLNIWFKKPSDKNREIEINHEITLEWEINNNTNKVEKMMGQCRTSSNKSLEIKRISKIEFLQFMNNDFL